MTVTVLSKPACIQCTATYRRLDAVGIEYEVRDISEDPSALALAKSLGYLQAPVVVIGDSEDHWAGFRPDKIEELASLLKVA